MYVGAGVLDAGALHFVLGQSYKFKYKASKRFKQPCLDVSIPLCCLGFTLPDGAGRNGNSIAYAIQFFSEDKLFVGQHYVGEAGAQIKIRIHTCGNRFSGLCRPAGRQTGRQTSGVVFASKQFLRKNELAARFSPPCVGPLFALCPHFFLKGNMLATMSLGLASRFCPPCACCMAGPWHHQVKFCVTIVQPTAFILHAHWSVSLAFILT